MTAMKDDDVARLLKELPRQEASAEFTSRVLARLEEPAPRRGTRRRIVALAAAAALVIGVWGARSAVREREEERRAAERLEQMQREYRALRMELEQLRSIASEVEPVLELGGTDRVDFIFDLRQFAGERGEARAEPASHRR